MGKMKRGEVKWQNSNENPSSLIPRVLLQEAQNYQVLSVLSFENFFQVTLFLIISE